MPQRILATKRPKTIEVLADEPHMVSKESYAAARQAPLDGAAVWRCPVKGCGALEYLEKPDGARVCRKSAHLSYSHRDTEPRDNGLTWSAANLLVMEMAKAVRDQDAPVSKLAETISGLLAASEWFTRWAENKDSEHYDRKMAQREAADCLHMATTLLSHAPTSIVGLLCAAHRLQVPEAVTEASESTLTT